MSASLPDAAREVLDFWFGAVGSAERGSPRKEWFQKSEVFDAQVRDRFGATIEQALRGELDDWVEDARSALARILLLDQFTRNAFRGTARAFAGDTQALAAASAMVGARGDDALPPYMRAFVYMPFEHAEGLAMQEEAVRLFRRLVAVDPSFADMLSFAEKHQAVIERFGRFPHRNELLGRRSTAEESAYLAQPGAGF